MKFRNLVVSVSFVRLQMDMYEEPSPGQDGIPSGYEAVSLIEALNGPSMSQHSGVSHLPTIPANNTLHSLYAAVVGEADTSVMS